MSRLLRNAVTQSLDVFCQFIVQFASGNDFGDTYAYGCMDSSQVLSTQLRHVVVILVLL